LKWVKRKQQWQLYEHQKLVKAEISGKFCFISSALVRKGFLPLMRTTIIPS
jgi:hypothetical protein